MATDLLRLARRRRRLVLHFLESLALHLTVGLDLAFAWRASLPLLESKQCPNQDDGEDFFIVITSSCTDPLESIWWNVIQSAYQAGAGMLEPVRAFSEALRRQESHEARRFLEALPTRLNVALLCFFLPPTLVLVTLPLVFEFLNAF